MFRVMRFVGLRIRCRARPPRHPSQLYEASSSGLVRSQSCGGCFWKTGPATSRASSSRFLFFYGAFRSRSSSSASRFAALASPRRPPDWPWLSLPRMLGGASRRPRRAAGRRADFVSASVLYWPSASGGLALAPFERALASGRMTGRSRRCLYGGLQCLFYATRVARARGDFTTARRSQISARCRRRARRLLEARRSAAARSTPSSVPAADPRPLRAAGVRAANFPATSLCRNHPGGREARRGRCRR